MMVTRILFLSALVFSTISCSNPSGADYSSLILGKWNTEKYISYDGFVKYNPYTIFNWYEQGFEFSEKDKVYPRRCFSEERNKPCENWNTDYNMEAGFFDISKGILTLESRSSQNAIFRPYKILHLDNKSLILRDQFDQEEWVDFYLIRVD